MKQEDFCRILAKLSPDVPEALRQRVESFLTMKVAQMENNMKENNKRAYAGVRRRRNR